MKGFLLLFQAILHFKDSWKPVSFVPCAVPYLGKKATKHTDCFNAHSHSHLICTEPQVFEPLNHADWRGFFSSSSLKSKTKGIFLLKKKRWSTYPRMLFAGAAAHVLSCFVARQRHTGLELVGVFSFKGIWEEVVWLAFKVSLADSLLTLHYAEGSINASFSDSFFACRHGY